MNKALILTAGFGNGHNAAAFDIRGHSWLNISAHHTRIAE